MTEARLNGSDVLDADRVSEDTQTVVDTQRRSVFADPLVRVLAVILGVVVIVFLGTLAAALYYGVLGSEVPRTSLERDLRVYEAETAAGSQDPEIWKTYVSALIDSRQYARAQQVITRGLTAVDNTSGAEMTFAQTQLYHSIGEHEQAVETATEGMAALNAYHEQQLAIDDSPEQKGQEISGNYWGMLLLRARSLVELERYEDALADFDAYLDEKRGDADVYVLRGDLKVTTDDVAGAEADYRQALRFVSDHEGALDGLKKLGVEE